jgi:SAM-dependent methyltransferase
MIRYRVASTSLHRINADRRLNRLQRGLWLAGNALNNLRPHQHLDPALAVRPFRLEPARIDWSAVSPLASPSRQLSDLFWSTLPWAAMRAELGALRVLDIGCGSGRYAAQFGRWAGGLDAYLGLDVKPHEKWDELRDETVRFGTYDGTSLAGQIPHETSLVVSQSAIEHFDDDLSVLEDVARFAAPLGRPLLQIHLAPASSALHLYPWHGVRQYTPRTLSKLSRLFSGYTGGTVYELGGRASNRLHWEFIARRQFFGGPDRRATERARYEAEVRAALEGDLRPAAPRTSPGFYALVLHSHPRRAIF